MNPPFKQRQLPIMVWGACLVALAAGFVLIRPAPLPYQSRAEQVEAAQSAEAVRVRKASASLASIVQSMSAAASSARPASEAEPLLTLAQPAPSERDPSADTPAHDGPPRLMVFESNNKLVAVLENRVMRIGDKTESGEVLRRIGRTFIVLKTPEGESRRIDMAESYVPRVASRPLEEVK